MIPPSTAESFNVVSNVLAAALEHVPPQTRNLLATGVQSHLERLRVHFTPTPPTAVPPADTGGPG